MRMNTKKVVVTGGCGFIGSALVSALVKQGFDVHIVDILVAGIRDRIHPQATFHEVDIRDFEKLLPIFENAVCVFHTAALPRVQPSIIDPRKTHDVNVNGTLNVLVAARDKKVGRVVYSASSSAYGDQQVFPLVETMPVHPMSPYALQKQMGEAMTLLFSELYGLQTVSLRYFNVYGPGSSSEGAYALVIAKFLAQKKQGVPLSIVPDGNQSRDFTHIRDIVRANILAMTSAKVGKGEVINIGGGHDYSVNQIAALFGGPTQFVEARIEPRRTLADIRRAEELLGWRPTITVEEGIAELKMMNGLE